MKTAISLILLLGNIFLLANGAPTQGPGDHEPSCTNVSFSVTVSADNFAIPIADTGPVVVPASGTFNIAARYCEPENKVPSRRKTLQFLIHGGSYTRNYWSGDGAPGSSFQGDKYSWIAQASKQGYPTLSIDSLGSGLSDHPDPITVVQLPMKMETVHAIIAKARAGNAPFEHKFDKIILVGHSLGSFTSNSLNAKYPQDADATILTGFAKSLNVEYLGPLFNTSLVPAAVLHPEKYGSLPPGYMMLNGKQAFEAVFWYPNQFDPQLLDLDWSLTGVVSVGEISSAFLGAQVATHYTGPVFVITAQHDVTMCNNPDPIVPGAPYQTRNCGSQDTGELAKSKALYPASQNYKWYAPPNSGHCWHFHNDAPRTFRIAHDWMAERGF